MVHSIVNDAPDPAQSAAAHLEPQVHLDDRSPRKRKCVEDVEDASFDGCSVGSAQDSVDSMEVDEEQILDKESSMGRLSGGASVFIEASKVDDGCSCSHDEASGAHTHSEPFWQRSSVKNSFYWFMWLWY